MTAPLWCSHCNGFGSSLREESDRCTRCNGTGLAPAVVRLEPGTLTIGDGPPIPVPGTPDPDLLVIIDPDGRFPEVVRTGVEEFIRDNADCLGPADWSDVRGLGPGDMLSGGGGAEPEWLVVKLARCAICHGVSRGHTCCPPGSPTVTRIAP